MIITILVMVAAALLIYFSCELFVNGIEWVGKAFNISQSAVGSVLAAFGTALPESIVTFIAVVFGASSSQKDIGIGAALGGPLVLSTIAYAVVGISIVMFSGRRKAGDHIKFDGKKLARDQVWFMCIFVFKIGLGLIAFAIKPWLGFLFLVAYGVYFYREMSSDNVEVAGELEPLKFSPKSENPKKSLILVQTIGSLIFIFIGSQMFVHNLSALSVSLGIPPHMVSLLLSPVATELPETLNAVIWVRQGKENLALSNISGSMMIQATVPSALGIIFTPWMLDKSLMISAIITFAAILLIWTTLKRHHLSAKRLSFNAVLYIVFIIGIFYIKGGI
ncbi:membrane protein [Clostridium carboxidivorans P7]|uniref:Sodium/calcium exchanger membrane region n=1 Tax=Clostridium carboxidivorans P7 TaxID=536227 RepID=C6PQ21_9CLOT|nr:sodium:calcium antiporter [Clostridium carboxidivorans]AKN29654.1 membrane protein [Clostridium carboxidivorans P7]EET88626.1 sodium/calcium exchanger membrane region [Clostridium carboxidivorans P7]EFG89416.1 sodium/calcium exchanger protein [Clostridium carboxidivorans P7]